MTKSRALPCHLGSANHPPYAFLRSMVWRGLPSCKMNHATTRSSPLSLPPPRDQTCLPLPRQRRVAELSNVVSVPRATESKAWCVLVRNYCRQLVVAASAVVVSRSADRSWASASEQRHQRGPVPQVFCGKGRRSSCRHPATACRRRSQLCADHQHSTASPASHHPSSVGQKLCLISTTSKNIVVWKMSISSKGIANQ